MQQDVGLTSSEDKRKFEEAVKAMEVGQAVTAINIIKALCEKNPTLTKLHMLLIDIYESKGEQRNARKVLDSSATFQYLVNIFSDC
jgi:thioredoxin-like negative regulator of GroEL